MGNYKQAKIVLYGLGATGKSASIATLFKMQEVRPNQRVIFLCTERNAMSGLEWGLEHYKIKLQKNQLITCTIRNKKKKAFVNETRALEAFSKQSSQQSKQSTQDNANKDKYTDYINIMKGLTTYKGIDYVTKEEITLGNIGDLEYEDILVIDGLTPIMLSLWGIVKGDRIGNDRGDYLIVQQELLKLTKGLIDIDCSVILLAHADKKEDDIEKKVLIRLALDAGVALASKYAGWWESVIYIYKDPVGKHWFTGKKQGVEVAVRNFPEQDKLLPDFSLYNFFK